MKVILFSAAIILMACQAKTPQYPAQSAQMSNVSGDKMSEPTKSEPMATMAIEGDTSLKKVVKTPEELRDVIAYLLSNPTDAGK